MFGLSKRSTIIITAIHTAVLGYLYFKHPKPQTGDEFGPPWFVFVAAYDFPSLVFMVWICDAIHFEVCDSLSIRGHAVLFAVVGSFQWILICALVRVIYLRLDRLANDTTEIDERIRKRRAKNRQELE